MDLFIDTTERGKIKLVLKDNNEILASPEKQTEKVSEFLLIEIERLLKKNKVRLKDLRQISVNPGPGGFSSTRTGVAVANALAFALNIPVVDAGSGKMKEIIIPKYAKEPNITKSKKF